MQEENINKKTAKKVDPIIYYELAEFDKENGTNHAERYMTAIKEDKKDDSVKITYDLQKLRKNKDMYFSDKHNLKSIAKRQSNIATVLLNKMRTRTKAILAALGIGGAALLGVASTNTGRGTDDLLLLLLQILLKLTKMTKMIKRIKMIKILQRKNLN